MATASAAVLALQPFLQSKYDRLAVSIDDVSVSLAEAIQPSPGSLPFHVAASVCVSMQRERE